jgi:outer membrane protein assembly factor BamB
VTDGAVYAASDNYVTAFSAATGAQLWQASFPGTVISTPAVQAGLVLLAYNQTISGQTRGVVAALNSATGSTVWSKRLSAPTGRASVATTPRRVYVVTATMHIVALGIFHGHRLWKSPALPGCLTPSTPAVAGSFVVLGGGGGYVSAVNASNGTVAWQDNLGGGCGGSADNWVPAISDGTVYAGLLNGVAALDLTSGGILWHNQSVGMVFFPLSVTGTTVIAGADDDTSLVALNRSNGSVRWQSAFQQPVVVAGDLATFGGLTWVTVEPAPDESTAQAVAFNRYTGHQVFSSAAYPDPTVDFPPPVVDAGHVYVNLATEVLCLSLPATTPSGKTSRRIPG